MDTRPARLTAADLPAGCDYCGNLVELDDNGVPVGGAVLADSERDYVFCTLHARDVRKANPFAQVVQLPPAPAPEPEHSDDKPEPEAPSTP